jgi:two-component system cell cycle response regulator DivK
MEKDAPTILIVEDFADSRTFLEKWLTDRNFRVLQASDGWQAVDLAVRERPSLILMDINIPVFDGIEAACMLRESEHVSNVPIVAMTAYDSADYREDARDVGFNDYLTKPIDFNHLETVINRLLAEEPAAPMPGVPDRV